MALTTVTVHGEFLAPVTNVPAVGSVSFDTLIELRDVVDNIVYARHVFNAPLDVNGEFTVVIPATDNPDLVPVNWVYQVYINTDVLNTVQYVQVPFAPGTTEFADLTPLDFDPCADLIPTSTPISPDQFDLFVKKTGDTMSGNLIINANLQVNGDAGVSNDVSVGGSIGVTGLGTFGTSVNTPLVTTTTVNASGDVTVGDDLQVSGDTNIDGALTIDVNGTSVNVQQALIAAQSTSPLSGGEFTPNADPTKIDISAMTGLIVDYNTSAPLSPTNPQVTFVNYPGVTALTPSFAPFTHYLVNSAGTLVQQPGTPTPAQRRQMIYLGLTLTQAGIIVVDQTLPVITSQVDNQLVDLMSAMAPFSTSGNIVGPNGANLTMSKTVGGIFARAFNQVPNYLDPHNSTLAAQAPINFRHITALVGSAGPLTTLLNVGFYDPNGSGVLTPIGGGANTSTNFRVFGFANNTVTEQVLIQYGQNTYASLTAAVQAIPSGTYIQQPATLNGALLGWISVTRTATDLSDPAQCVFTKASKFANP